MQNIIQSILWLEEKIAKKKKKKKNIKPSSTYKVRTWLFGNGAGIYSIAEPPQNNPPPPQKKRLCSIYNAPWHKLWNWDVHELFVDLTRVRTNTKKYGILSVRPISNIKNYRKAWSKHCRILCGHLWCTATVQSSKVARSFFFFFFFHETNFSLPLSLSLSLCAFFIHSFIYLFSLTSKS